MIELLIVEHIRVDQKVSRWSAFQSKLKPGLLKNKLTKRDAGDE
jgi:hypothetical protein